MQKRPFALHLLCPLCCAFHQTPEQLIHFPGFQPILLLGSRAGGGGAPPGGASLQEEPALTPEVEEPTQTPLFS